MTSSLAWPTSEALSRSRSTEPETGPRIHGQPRSSSEWRPVLRKEWGSCCPALLSHLLDSSGGRTLHGGWGVGDVLGACPGRGILQCSLGVPLASGSHSPLKVERCFRGLGAILVPKP